jgi:hypothetical protein
MKAKVGDLLVISGHKAGDRERRVEIVRVLGADGAPPYRVRWEDAHESNVYPGSDMRVEPHAPAPKG